MIGGWKFSGDLLSRLKSLSCSLIFSGRTTESSWLLRDMLFLYYAAGATYIWNGDISCGEAFLILNMAELSSGEASSAGTILLRPPYRLALGFGSLRTNYESCESRTLGLSIYLAYMALMPTPSKSVLGPTETALIRSS